MSNKIALIIVALFATLSLTAQTASEANDTIKRVGNHSWKDLEDHITPETTGWSIFINGGFSHFDGDNGVKLATSEQMSFDGGLGFAYTFTPLWSIMAEWHTTTYGQHMFDKSMNIGEELVTNGGRSLGHLNTVGAGIEFNLMDAIFPRDKKNLFNIYLQAGGGLGIYSYHGAGYNYDYNPTTGELRGFDPVYDAYTNGKGKWVASDKSPEYSKTNTAAYIYAGVLAEFNVTRIFGIGLRAYYDYFMNDYIDGGTSANNKNNKNNDGLFACDMSFRFNILAKKKSHWRNIASMDEFYKMFEDENLKKTLAGLGDGLSDGNGRLKDTLVISHKDTIVSIEKTKQEVKLPDRHFYVYFDNDKDNVKPDGQITIQQVAELLESNPNLCAEIVGQCDNTGNLEYNKKLAQRRANNVLEEFVEEFGFDSERAYTVSKGIVVSKRSKTAFGPNRRVDIHIVEKEKFLEMKAAHEAELEAERKAAEKPAEDKVAEPVAQVVEAATEAAETVKGAAESLIDKAKQGAADAGQKLSLEEKRVQKAVEDAKAAGYNDQKKIVTVQDGETLSKIARREYGNVNCWVYIYEANAVRLGNNASNVRPGMVLFLPTLTDTQLAITKEEAHDRYEARK